MLPSSCSVSNWFFNSSWNCIFFDPICSTSTLGDLVIINCFRFLYVQFDVVPHNQSVVTSNVDFVTSMTMSGLFVGM